MSSVVVRCCTYIHPEHFDRHAVRCLPFMNWEWISFSSLRWVCRLDRMSSVYMSGSLGRDSLPSLLLLPAITFDPPPPPISLGWDGGQKKPASVRESACRWSYDACRPFVQQAVPAARQQLSSARSDERGGTFFLLFFLPPSRPHIVI